MPETKIADRQLLTAPGGGTSAWTTLSKPTEEFQTANTVLADDSSLKFDTTTTSGKFLVRGLIAFSTTALADFKYKFNYTGTIGLWRAIRRHNIAAATAQTTFLDYTSAVGMAAVSLAGTASGGGFIQFEGVFWNNATGTFSFQWAQNTSDATSNATSVLAASYIEYLKAA